MQAEKLSKVKVLVVDDHPVVRVGIGAIINTQPDMTVVAETGKRRRGYIAIS